MTLSIHLAAKCRLFPVVESHLHTPDYPLSTGWYLCSAPSADTKPNRGHEQLIAEIAREHAGGSKTRLYTVR